MTALERYEDKLRSLPASGGGGCHSALLGVANLGIMAGLSERQVFDDLRQHVHGKRRVSDREIQDAIRKASKSDFSAPSPPRYAPAFSGTKARTAIVERGFGATEADVWEASPVRIDWEAEEDSAKVIEYLYQPDEVLFIGDDPTPGKPGQTVRTAGEWLEYFRKTGPSPFPKIIPNPLSGRPGPTKDGKESHRADSCVAAFRYVIAEFDSVPLEDQFAFWYGARLPVAALIHSGKKSLHAWVRVDCADAAEWEAEVELKLFPQILQPLGLDPACKNEARLSRMPGHVRADTGLPQKLLYLAPGGRAVNA